MDAALSLVGLTKSFGAKRAVDGLNLQVRQGCMFGLVGPNGAGKTTTLSMATGLLRPDAGTAFVLGHDVWSDPAAAKALMGVLPDGLRLFDRLSGAELLRYVGLLRRVPPGDIVTRSAELLEALSLTEDRNTLVVEYSAGMTKKIGLACALISAPRLLMPPGRQPRTARPARRPAAGATAEGRKVAESSWVDRLFPATPADGVAARALRYWRRDPRYLAGLAGFLVGPVILIVVQVTNPSGAHVVAMLAPSLVGLLVGVSVAQDLSYDGSAIWLHAWSGVRGADDRAGRVWAAMVVFLPLIVIMVAVSVAVTGQWRLLAPAAALAIGLALASLGVGSVVGTLWQWPAPPPGANPFAGSNKGGPPSLLSFTLATFSTLAVGLPTIGLVIWSFFTPWVGLVALVVGLASGVVVLRIGIGWGGRLLDRRWPEVLQAVSERAG